jgi:hypothetical protein
MTSDNAVPPAHELLDSLRQGVEMQFAVIGHALAADGRSPIDDDGGLIEGSRAHRLDPVDDAGLTLRDPGKADDVEARAVPNPVAVGWYTVPVEQAGREPVEVAPEAGRPEHRSHVGGSQVETADKDEDDTIKPLPDRLVTELTAHRTLALRNALANDPEVAFQAVLHNFVLATFYRFASSSGCLEMAIRTPTFPALAPGLKESALRRKPSTSGTMVGKPVCRGAKKTCGSRRSTGKSRPRCLRIVRHPRSTRSMSLPTAIMKAVSPRILSVNGSAKPMCWLVPSTLDMVAAG